MSYTIRYSDPSKANFAITVQADNIYNSVGTGGLTLVGRNYPAYGEFISENFIRLLENSASPVPPINPIEGQLWFDTSDPNNKKLRINDGAANVTLWKPINGIFQQANEPTNAAAGDIWVDTTENLVKLYTSNLEFEPVGRQITESGTGVEAQTVSDSFGDPKVVLVSKVSNEIVSVLSNDSFTTGELLGFNNINVGINLPTDPIQTSQAGFVSALLHGTATKAKALELLSGALISADNVLRNDTAQTINGQFTVKTDQSALRIGEIPTFTIEKFSIEANFINDADTNGTFNFKIKRPIGVPTTVLSINGGGSSAGGFVEVGTAINQEADTAITGALRVRGGVGISGNAFVGGTLYTNRIRDAVNSPGSNGEVLVAESDGTVRWKPFNENAFATDGSLAGVFTLTNSLNATGLASGTLQVTGGGASIQKDLYVGERIIILATTATTSPSSGALTVAGGVGIAGDLRVAGDIYSSRLLIDETVINSTVVQTGDVFTVLNTATSTSTTSGALRVSGGIGVARDVYVGGSVTVVGGITATVSGVATSATNIIGGVSGSIPIQLATSQTGFISTGTVDQFLRSGSNTAAFVSTSTMYVNSAVQAERFRTPRTITFTGDVTGTFVLDGTQATGTALTIQPNSIALGTDTVGDYVSTGTTTGNGISGSITGEGTTFNVNSNATSTNDVSTIVFRNSVGSFAANNITAVQFNGSAQGLTNIPGLQIDNLSVRNSSLTSSTVGFVAGTAISISTATVELGDSITITNTGVTSLTGSSHLAVSASSGAVTLTNNGVRSISTVGAIGVDASTGTIIITDVGVRSIVGSDNIAVSTSTGTVTITNNGVRTLTGSAFLAVSQSTGTVTITNNGVQTLTGSAFLAVSQSTGTVTISNNGVHSLSAGQGISVSGSTGTITISSDPNTITATIATTYIGITTNNGVSTFTNMGVQTLTGSAHLAVSASTGTVTITNNGVRTLTGSAYLAVSQSTGTVTITNNGVQTLTGSAFLAVSQSTGTVTIGNNGVHSVSVIGALGVSASTGTITITDLGVRSILGSPFIGVDTSTGTVTIANNGVHTITAGTDTSVSASTGTVTVWNNSTLQTITARGSASSNAIQITNATAASSVSTGALVVSGGTAIGGDLRVGQSVFVTSNQTITGTLTLDGATQNLGSATGATTINLGYGVTTTGNTKTVNIGTSGGAGSTTLINIGSPSGTLSSSTVFGDLVITGALLLQAGNGVVLTSISTVTVTTFTGTPTGATFYFTDISPPKLGIYGASAWRDAIGNVLF
jgi:hypothetical protein